MKPGEIRAGVRRLFELAVRRPERAAADADAELQSLVDEQALYLMARGMPEAAARGEALRRVGGTLSESGARVHRSAEQRERRLKLHEWLEDLVADLRYAVRTLRRSPALAGAALLTLALPIGANTAIFSAVSAVLLRPLPFRDPARLVMLWEENPDFHWHQADAAPANMLDWKEQAGVFSDVAGYPDFAGTATLTGYGEPRLLNAQPVTGNFFDLLGIRAALGRTFRDAETWRDGGPPGVVLSHRAWRDVFGADRGLVGRSVQLGGRATEVIGVLPEGFAFPGLEADVWQTVRWDRSDRAQIWFRRAHWLRVIGRLKPGVTLGGADAALQAVVTRLKRDYPVTNIHMGAGLTPLHEFLAGNTKLPLLVMFGAVATLLLIACANVANLLLVRAAGREREAALRLALGAGRGRLLRQALAESLLLAGLGGAAGLGLGWWGVRMLAALQPEGMLPVHDITLSWRVLLYVSGAAALSALLCGAAPMLWTGRRVPADVLRDEGRTASGGRRARHWGDVLLASQVALALTLTLGAGLLVRSYLRLQRVGPGFDSHNVLAVQLTLPGTRYDSTRKVLAFYAELERQARALPGAEAAALVSLVPLGPSSWSSQMAIAGRQPIDGQVVHRELSPEYQRVMRVPLLRGRLLSEADRQDAPYVVLINETLARTYFRGEDPLGQRLIFDRVPDSTSNWRTVVGVVGDERQSSLAVDPQPEILEPYPQESRNGMTLLIRTANDPASLAPAARRLVARLDPLLAISSIKTMDEVRSQSLARDRFLAVLMLAFAGVGMVLGIVGVYGVVAQLARRRMREMGIRIALGARGMQVQWLVVRHGVTVTGIGIGLGLLLALAATRVIRTLLFQVAPIDPLTFMAVPVLVLLTAGLASWLPAARASRADPCQVLRMD